MVQCHIKGHLLIEGSYPSAEMQSACSTALRAKDQMTNTTATKNIDANTWGDQMIDSIGLKRWPVKSIRGPMWCIASLLTIRLQAQGQFTLHHTVLQCYGDPTHGRQVASLSGLTWSKIWEQKEHNRKVKWINNLKKICKDLKKAPMAHLEQHSRKWQVRRHQATMADMDSGFKNSGSSTTGYLGKNKQEKATNSDPERSLPII